MNVHEWGGCRRSVVPVYGNALSRTGRAAVVVHPYDLSVYEILCSYHYPLIVAGRFLGKRESISDRPLDEDLEYLYEGGCLGEFDDSG